MCVNERGMVLIDPLNVKERNTLIAKMSPVYSDDFFLEQKQKRDKEHRVADWRKGDWL